MVVGIITIIPTAIMIRIYIKVKITEYLLFSMFFLLGITILFLDPLAGLTNSLVIIQLHHLFIDLSFLILFFHAIRMIWVTPPKIVMIIGLGWYFLLLILTLTWNLFVQPQNSAVIFSFLNLPHNFSSYYNLGAGLQINDVIIYSSAFRYIGDFYRLFILGFLLYAYAKLQVIETQSNRVTLAKNLWITVWFMLLMHSLSLFFQDFEIVSVFLFVGSIIIICIALFLPEGLLLSYPQLIRVQGLYSKMMKEETEINFSITQNLRDYFKQVPAELWEK